MDQEALGGVFQALLSAHDTVAQRDYGPVLPPMPDELPEDEEATRTVCLVKNNQPLVSRRSHRRSDGKRVAGSTLSAVSIGANMLTAAFHIFVSFILIQVIRSELMFDFITGFMSFCILFPGRRILQGKSLLF